MVFVGFVHDSGDGAKPDERWKCCVAVAQAFISCHNVQVDHRIRPTSNCILSFAALWLILAGSVANADARQNLPFASCSLFSFFFFNSKCRMRNIHRGTYNGSGDAIVVKNGFPANASACSSAHRQEIGGGYFVFVYCFFFSSFFFYFFIHLRRSRRESRKKCKRRRCGTCEFRCCCLFSF